DRPYLQDALQRALAGEDALDVQFRVLHSSGQHRWMVSQGRVVRDPAGQVRYVTGVCLDVTDRKLLEERLRQAQRMDSIGQLGGWRPSRRAPWGRVEGFARPPRPILAECEPIRGSWSRYCSISR